jgi:hypothetical protein
MYEEPDQLEIIAKEEALVIEDILLWREIFHLLES